MIIIFWILFIAWIIDVSILIYTIILGMKAEALYKSVMNYRREIYIMRYGNK